MVYASQVLTTSKLHHKKVGSQQIDLSNDSSDTSNVFPAISMIFLLNAVSVLLKLLVANNRPGVYSKVH